MRKLLFVHDHYFNRHDEIIYSRQFPANILKRYLTVFDGLIFWGRIKEVEQKPQNMSTSMVSGVSFHFGESISGLRNYYNHYYSEKERLSKLVQNTDALIVRLPSEYGLMAIHLAKHLNIPYGIEVVGCAWDAYWNYGSLQAKLYAPLAYYRMKKAVSDSDFTIYVSKHFLQKRYPPKNEATVANISNVEIQQPSEDVLSDRINRIKTLNKTITFGTIGSLKTSYKGVHMAIRAIAELENSNIEYRVLGSGDISYYEALANRLGIGGRVHFEGKLPSGNPVLKWLDSIDVYIHPSMTEGLPRAVIEAMSRGCPVLASTAGGTPELVNKKWLHNPGNYSELGSQMIEMLKSQSTMIQQARENFETSKRYSKDKLDKKRDNILIELRSLAEQEN